MSKPQIATHISKSVTFTVYDAKWVPSSARFIVLGNFARGTGAIQAYELDQGKANQLFESEKRAAFKCGTFAASSVEDRHLATGDFEGRVSLWNLERMELPIWTAKEHSQIINAIDGVGGIIGGGAPEIATASRDGKVFIWDPRTTKPVASIISEDKKDCWSVSFGNSLGEERVVCAGFDNGDLKLFDLRKNAMRWETNLGHGICGIEFDRKDIEMNKLVVTLLGGTFKVFDVRTQHPKSGFASVTQEAHGSTVWTGRHLPQNRDLFVTTGGNGGASLWKYSYPNERKKKDTEGIEMGVSGKLEELATAEISTQPVLSWDWHTEKEGLAVVGALDQSVKIVLVTKTKLF